MAVITRVEPIDKDIDLIIRQDLSPAALSATLAQFAYEEIEEAKEINRRSIGVVPPYTVYVDGRKDAPLASVKPDGIIVAEFELVQEVLAWISTQLQKHSPVLTGFYAKNHELFADGVEVDPNNPPPAEEYVFVNATPYARKIEGDPSRAPQSRQAPAGVYQVVAKLARDKFHNVARIGFSYRTALGGQILTGRLGDRGGSGKHNMRNPAVIVRLGR